jgi:hypothetical protein
LIYQYDENKQPDSEFHPGSYKDIVPGNEGRLLDPRRTPISILDVKPDSGFFVIEIRDFEDKGAQWEMPLEQVDKFQFTHDGKEASQQDIEAYQEIVERLDQPLIISANPKDLVVTESKIQSLRDSLRQWFKKESEFLKSELQVDFSSQLGIPDLWKDLQRYMESQGLWDMEEAFARGFVSNPNSGELVKGHCIVLAELGLVSFEGTVVRDPETFRGKWTKERREDHILHRLAFIRELFHQLGHTSVVLYRGASFEDQPQPRKKSSLISTTFNREVAMSHFRGLDDSNTGILYRQRVPVERIFMTYLETEGMNTKFKESEAVLFNNQESSLF